MKYICDKEDELFNYLKINLRIILRVYLRMNVY